MQKLDLSPRPAPIPDPPEGSGILGLSSPPPTNGHPHSAAPAKDMVGKPVNVDFHMLLAEMQDDVTRSRLREALWISVIIHMIAFFAVPRIPGWLHLQSVEVVAPQESLKDKDLTFLELPPDMQKLKVKPDTSRISDKDRLATTRTPQLDQKTLEHLRASRAPGAPGMNPQQPSPPQQAMNASPPPGAAQTNDGFQQQQSQNQSRLQTPPQAQAPSFKVGGSASSMMENATRASAATHAGGIGGDNGAGPGRGSINNRNNYEILSDTMGVDFGPYMQRVLEVIRRNWYLNIPESAMPPLSKQGELSIDFAIQANGRVGGMRLSGPSGDMALDRAAWSGIALSDPFQPLPKEFKGPYLAVRIRFIYNPDRGTIR